MATHFDNNNPQSGHEHIRQRPEMYVGGTDQDAMHQLAFEVLNHSVNEALSNQCDQITVTLRDNNEFCIHDNGPGIYTDPHGDEGKPFLEVFMTDIGFHLNQKDKKLVEYKVEGGLHGVGLAVINPLCRWLRVESMYRNVVYAQNYEQGIPTNEVDTIRRLEKGESTGTVIALQPDPSIFTSCDFDYDVLANRAYEVTALIPGLQIRLVDERGGQTREDAFQQQDSLGEFLALFNQSKTALHTPLVVHHTMQTISPQNETLHIYVDVALQYTDGNELQSMTYVNTVPAAGGGIHQRALYSALTDRLNEIARDNQLLSADDADFTLLDIMPGLTSLVSIKHPEPEYRGVDDDYLCNPEVYGAVAGAVYQTEIPNDVLQIIVDRCQQNRAGA